MGEETNKPEKEKSRDSPRKKETITYVIPITIGLVILILGIITNTFLLTITGIIISIASPFILLLYWRKKKYGRITLKKYRFTEKIIPLNQELYILGTATPTKEKYEEATENAIVKRTDEHNTLVISDKKEEELTKSTKYAKKLILGGLGLILLLPITLYLFISGLWIDIDVRNTLVLGFLIFLSAGMFIKGFQEMKFQQTAESTPTSKISSMAMGLVELKGKAKAKTKKVKSPFTGKKCATYQAKVEKYIHGGRNSRGRWVTIKKLEKRPIFYLDDGSGKVPVDPTEADIKTHVEFKKKTKNLKELPEPAKETLKEGKVTDIEWKENSKVGY